MTCKDCSYFISIHAAREGGDPTADLPEPNLAISIHAAREGGDAAFRATQSRRKLFQSTPPVKAATVSVAVSVPVFRFQSTPPVKAATCCGVQPSLSRSNFNPRRP